MMGNLRHALNIHKITSESVFIHLSNLFWQTIPCIGYAHEKECTKLFKLLMELAKEGEGWTPPTLPYIYNF